MLNVDFLNRLREAELELILRDLRPGSTVLEFGAGTGIQAKQLSNLGFQVLAIDLAGSGYSGVRVFDVKDYDGKRIPLPDRSVDVVFSSNVLEHVEDLDVTFAEFRRVLKPDGYCVHLMPSVPWRAWTFASGIPEAAASLGRLAMGIVRPCPGMSRLATARRQIKSFAGALLPIGHGTSFEGISELWSFSTRAWRSKFKRHGFVIESCRPTGLFHTGHMLLGPALEVGQRKRLAPVLGSAANVFVVRPA